QVKKPNTAQESGERHRFWSSADPGINPGLQETFILIKLLEETTELVGKKVTFNAQR
ncbi:hypothetical protein HGM15179_010600, partial [Zosterops borbonicus]